MAIDWTDPKAQVSKHFSVGELLWLPTWSRLATEGDGLDEHVKGQLVAFAGSMDKVRQFVAMPIVVHCWFRPREYNSLPSIGGARHSAHMCEGSWAAVDFHVGGFDGTDGCAEIRAKLLPMLDAWGMRMENRVGTWIHLDSRQPNDGQPRFFIP